jgi:Mg2+/Co2+ transporter CorB
MTNLEQLKKFNNDIKILINEYDLKYLDDIYEEIMGKIVNEEKKEYEKKMELEKIGSFCPLSTTSQLIFNPLMDFIS